MCARKTECEGISLLVVKFSRINKVEKKKLFLLVESSVGFVYREWLSRMDAFFLLFWSYFVERVASGKLFLLLKKLA